MALEEKTGTTIVGIRYTSGVVLCADTRSTSGPVVANKNCEKIHFVFDNIMCCGAGTAADTRRVTRMASRELQLFAYKHIRQPYVTHAERLIVDHLHAYGGQIGAALVLGGVDSNGVRLFTISPHGYSAELEFTSMGSGSYAAIAVLEKEYRRGMSKDEAVALGVRAVQAGVMNDLYSGSNVDVCVVDLEGVERRRNYLRVESRKDEGAVRYPQGSVAVLKEDFYNYVEVVED